MCDQSEVREIRVAYCDDAIVAVKYKLYRYGNRPQLTPCFHMYVHARKGCDQVAFFGSLFSIFFGITVLGKPSRIAIAGVLLSCLETCAAGCGHTS